MKKITAIIVILLVNKLFVIGQISIGLSVGENFCKQIQKGEYEDNSLIILPDYTDNSINTGFTFGLPIELNISEKVSFYSVPSYLVKGTRFKSTIINENQILNFNGSVKSVYFELPMIGKYYLFKNKVNAFITFGPSIGYLHRQKVFYNLDILTLDNEIIFNEEIEEIIESKELNDTGFDRFDFSLNASIGIEYNLSLGKLVLNCNYMYGLNDIIYLKWAESKEVSIYNRGITATIGYLIPLNP